MIVTSNTTSGNVYGSSALQTSQAGVEVLPSGIRIANLSVICDTATTISFNGGTPIYVRANQNILIDVCTSMKFVSSGVTFTWMGQAY